MTRILATVLVFALMLLPEGAEAEVRFALEPVRILAESFSNQASHELRAPNANSGGECAVALARDLTAPVLTKLLHTELLGHGIAISPAAQNPVLRVHVLDLECSGSGEKKAVSAPLMLYRQEHEKSKVRALLQAEVLDRANGTILRSLTVSASGANRHRSNSVLFYSNESGEKVVMTEIFRAAFQQLAKALQKQVGK